MILNFFYCLINSRFEEKNITVSCQIIRLNFLLKRQSVLMPKDKIYYHTLQELLNNKSCAMKYSEPTYL